MLVLTRKIDEQIVLPDRGVTVTVLSVSGGRVKLGVCAPPDTRILRRELLFRQLDPNDSETVAGSCQDLVSSHVLETQSDQERLT